MYLSRHILLYIFLIFTERDFLPMLAFVHLFDYRAHMGPVASAAIPEILRQIPVNKT